MFREIAKSRLVSWEFSLTNFRENPKTPKKEGVMKNVKKRKS